MSKSNNVEEFLGRFPKTHEFVDCTGKKRRFQISFPDRESYGFRCFAHEIVSEPNGYEFSTYSEAGPITAFTELTEKIHHALAQRFLNPKSSSPCLLTNKAQGHVAHGGVVIDGRFISWEEFSELMQTNEGWEFKLEFFS